MASWCVICHRKVDASYKRYKGGKAHRSCVEKQKNSKRKVNEVGQRKLTEKELEHVRMAKCGIFHMCHWELTQRGRRFWEDAYTDLCEMSDSQTADGKPYVNPVPEIGEGYRAATDADKGRKDMEVWDPRDRAWRGRRCADADLVASNTYRVPIDHIPTDDDARERPLVMVRDFDDRTWCKATLLGVAKRAFFPFCVIATNGETGVFRHCRFPYPGE